MKYIWIVMLIIAEIIWFIASLKDFIKTAKRLTIKRLLNSLEMYTVVFIITHLLTLFVYSLSLFIAGRG